MEPRFRRWSELALLFGMAPLGLFVFRRQVAPFIVPILLGVGGLCLLALWRDPGFDRARLGGLGALRGQLRRIALRLLVGGSAIALATWLAAPQLFLAFPSSRPRVWLLVMVLYPVLSAYPQEVIFRAFFFHRYQGLFGDGWRMVVASAVAFGFAHIFLANWLAPILGAAGGVLFGTTYRSSGSTLTASAEHALWGDLLFTVGAGWYFYAGSIA